MTTEPDTGHGGLRRASRLFFFEERLTDSPYVDSVARTMSVPEAFFTSVADTHWSMVVTRLRGRTYLSIRGPETAASVAAIPQDADFLILQFRLGTFMPDLPVSRLIDIGLDIEGTRRSFPLLGSHWDFPDFENLDYFVARLAREGLLVRDTDVEDALEGRPTGLSARTLQRRVLRATGLTQGAIHRIERARYAAGLLDEGLPILDVVERSGYADQPHMTRALTRLVGQSPGQILKTRPPA